MRKLGPRRPLRRYRRLLAKLPVGAESERGSRDTTDPPDDWLRPGYGPVTNVPIPGGGGVGAPASRRRRGSRSRQRFLAAVAVLAVGGLVTVLLAIGEPWRLTPDTTGSIWRSLIAVALTFLLVVPAFAVFQFERASAGAAWHEPAWRPTTIGVVGLALALLSTLGWHGLRLAFYVARVWTGGP